MPQASDGIHALSMQMLGINQGTLARGIPPDYDLTVLGVMTRLIQSGLTISDAGVFGGLSGFGFVNVKDRAYGAKGDGVTNDAAAFQAANDALPAGGGIIFLPTPASNYLVNTTVTFGKGRHVIGTGLHSCVITNASGGASPVFRTSSGGGGGSIFEGFQLQVVNSGDIGVQLLGVDRCTIRDFYIYTPTGGFGTAIQLSNNGVSGAYLHRIYDGIIHNTGIGVDLVGDNVSNTIERCHIISDAAIHETSGSNCAANRYIGNTLQSRTGTIGTPVGIGIDLQWDGATGGGDARVIDNYIERFEQGILIRSGSLRNKIYVGEWDNNTTNISDLNANTNGASVIDLDDAAPYMSFGSSLRTQGSYYVRGDPSVRDLGFRSIDTRASGRGYFLGNGYGGAGRFVLRDDTDGTLPWEATAFALNIGKRLCGARGSDVVAANDLTLTSGNLFHITGGTQINAIITANWQSGSIVTFIFDSTPTVKHNTAGGAGTAVILLAGAADFVAGASDTLMLQYDGTSWYEVGRTVI